jgi:aspartyl protease family protein
MKRWLFSLFLISATTPALAVDITVQALFKDKAMVSIDGTSRLLKKDKPSPEGVKLISADSEKAVLEVDGVQSTYKLGQTVLGNYNERDAKQVTLFANEHGMFTTLGSINGVNVRFLVDTGASSVAISAAQARRIGIKYYYEGTPIAVGTASGVAQAYMVTFDRVQVGGIVLNNVRGAVVEGAGPGMALLGTTFLKRLKVENDGKIMTMQQKY